MERSLTEHIRKDLNKKIVLLSGPRQCGKTTLSKMLFRSYDYLNYDDSEQRQLFQQRTWDRAKDLVILDELHKMKNWKGWLKGVFDAEGIRPRMLVTGSGRLDIARKMGDSLAGRFLPFRLHPLDLKEIQRFLKPKNLEESLSRLLDKGGFPEPFLDPDPVFYPRWRRAHLDIILRQDLLSVETVQQVTAMETLVQLLRGRVGSPISYQSLSEDLQVSDKTVKRWIQILENLFVIFRINPFHHNVARSLTKSPKIYFFDIGQVEGEPGIRFENLVACALLKEIHYREDVLGEAWNLSYLRTKDKQEVDFLVLKDRKPRWMIECKWGDGEPAKALVHFSRSFISVRSLQLVRDLKREVTFPDGLEVRRAVNWLSEMPL